MRYELHPQNRAFQWQVPEPVAHLGARHHALLSAEQIEAFQRDGFVALQDVFSAQEVAALCSLIDPLEAAAEAALRQRPNGRQLISRADEITFRAHLVLRSEALAQFCRHPSLLAICRDLLGPDVRLYWEQCVYKKPGMREEFPWHQDNGYTFLEPQQYLTCWIAMTEATQDNGCPWVVPNLHTLGTLAHRWTEYGFCCLNEVEGAVPIELRPGGIALFSSLTPHRTIPNLTSAPRKAYIVQYAPDGASIQLPNQAPQLANAPGRQFMVLRDGRAEIGG